MQSLKLRALSPSTRDTVGRWILYGFASLASSIIIFIGIFLLIESYPAMRKIGLLHFISDPSWHPLENLYNLLPMLIGSLLTVIGALLIAVPCSILCALFCQFYAPIFFATLFHRMMELLAGIPSVVYGFWGLVVLVPLIANIQAPGTSLGAAIIVLSIMITPTLTLLLNQRFADITAQHEPNSAALGINKSAFIMHIILPLAKPTLITGTILQTGRAIGETMAVLMVCGNVVQIPNTVFDPIRTLTTNIALEVAYAMNDHRSALFVSGLLLLVIVGCFIIAAELTKHRIADA